MGKSIYSTMGYDDSGADRKSSNINNMFKPMCEADYNYEYPIKALWYGAIELDLRLMRTDEMPDNGIIYYCAKNGAIYIEGEPNFEIIK
jgi:hypothetical protein